MIKPYTAVGLIPTVRGIRKREDIKINLDHLSHLVKAASWLSSLDLPVRLIAFPEGALQAFNDEVLDLDHATFARECAIDIPGEETEALGVIAKEYNAFVMAQAKARHPDWPDRYFNVGFILNPRGKVILKHYKVSPLFPVEHSMCPHDVYDWWVEKYGRNLQAFWPVVDTEIGRLGIMMANEGSYPENARALALNGAEVVYRASYPHPATGNEIFEIQSRARALDNNMYVVAPNMGTYYLFPEEATPIDTFGGRSFVIDYKGRIVGRQDYGAGSTYVGGVIDIEALRDHRARAQWDNWMKDLRTELYQLLYEKPIYPKNLYLKRAPMKHKEYRDKVIKRQVKLMHDRDIWKKPDAMRRAHLLRWRPRQPAQRTESTSRLPGGASSWPHRTLYSSPRSERAVEGLRRRSARRASLGLAALQHLLEALPAEPEALGRTRLRCRSPGARPRSFVA